MSTAGALPAALVAPCAQAIKAGRLADAEPMARAVVRDYPDHPDSHHLAGFVALRLGRPDDALACFDAALARRGDHVGALVHGGHALRALGRDAQALRFYDRALAVEPTQLEALHGRGHALAELGRAWEAVEGYARAIAAAPDFLDAYIGKGNVLVTLERLAEAVACFDQALARLADLPDAKLAVVAHLHYFRADALLRQDRFDAAVAGYDRALALLPDYHEALLGQGRALTELGDHADALDCFTRACALRPDDVRSHDYRSRALRELGAWGDAVAAAERAVALAPDDTGALTALGHGLRAVGRVDDAEAAYAKAVAIKPDMGPLLFNHAICLLLQGDYERGWPAYEARWTTERMSKRKPSFAQTLWLGQQDIAGRRILLHAEQGHGDTIQFCRYAPLVAARGAHVVLGVQAGLRPLMAGLDGVADVVDRAEAMPVFDLHCPLMSLPLAFGTRLDTIPATVPYLAPPAGHRAMWRDRLGRRQGPRIGIAWSGNARHQNDRNRSIALEALRPIARLGVGLYCLQRELRSADMAAFAMFGNVAFFGGQMLDFADTAALIAELDLVISVDTAVAHLAGAMGKPVWLMLAAAPDWRWLLSTPTSPWYPTARLFRQRDAGDWTELVAEVCAALQVFLAEHAMDHGVGDGR